MVIISLSLILLSCASAPLVAMEIDTETAKANAIDFIRNLNIDESDKAYLEKVTQYLESLFSQSVNPEVSNLLNKVKATVQKIEDGRKNKTSTFQHSLFRDPFIK